MVVVGENMFIINFFLEYVLFFILLVVLTIALLSEFGKITVHRSLYLPTILLGMGLNFLFFDLIIDPILGIRSSFLAVCAGLLIGMILFLFHIITKENFCIFLAICAFVGIYRLLGYILFLLGVAGVYFLINLVTKCRYLPKVRCICTNGFLICISGIIYSIIVLI